MIRTLMIGLFAVSLAGCTYSGVGSVSISPTPAGDAKDSAEPILTGTFDSVLSRKDGDVFTFTAYQRVRSRKGFSEAYRNYKKDAPFVNAELIVRVRRDGTVVGKPRLLLRQGENVLTAGTLEGSIALTPDDNQLTIAGSNLQWRFTDTGEPSTQDVSFRIQVYNVLDRPAPSAPLTPAATT